MSESTISGAALAATKRRIVRVSREDGQVVANAVEVGDGMWSRFLGLMGRANVYPDEGLWLIPCRSVHMYFMRTAIDVIFLDKHHRVVRVLSRLRPWTTMVWPVWKAQSALELAPGTAERLAIRVGELLNLESPALARSNPGPMRP